MSCQSIGKKSHTNRVILIRNILNCSWRGFYHTGASRLWSCAVHGRWSLSSSTWGLQLVTRSHAGGFFRYKDSGTTGQGMQLLGWTNDNLGHKIENSFSLSIPVQLKFGCSAEVDEYRKFFTLYIFWR